MKNYHNVEVYNNGGGYRIALEVFTGTRIAITIESARKLKESLEYGLARALSDDKKCPVCWSDPCKCYIGAGDVF